MAREFLFNLPRQEDQRTPTFSGLCKRVRFRHSDCQRCLDICPENAIALEPGPIINNRCTSCGLCQTACPTEVFQDEVHTDQYLLSQINPSGTKDQPAVTGQCLFIHCQEAEKQDENSFRIPCLGSITENFVLGAALQGVDEVVLTKGTCSQCRLKEGEQLLMNSIATFRVLSESVELKEFTLSLREKQKEAQESLSRRELFSRIFGEQQVETKLSPQDKTVRRESASPRNGTRPSPKREFLRTLLENTVLHDSSTVRYEQAFPWATIKIDEQQCVTCGTCVSLCPTGAVSRKIENGQLSHYFNASRCTNCRLCGEACPENVISYEEVFPLTDILNHEPKAVTKISMNSCLICGEVVPAKEGEVCTTCQKRQML